MAKKKLTAEEIKQQELATTAQNLMPVADITSLMRRKDGEYVAYIKMDPLNLTLLSKKEQNEVIKDLAEVFNSYEEDVQIFCTGRPVDLTGYLDDLKSMAKSQNDIIRKRILNESLAHAHLVMSSGEIIERIYFFILHGKDEQVVLSKAKEFRDRLNLNKFVAQLCSGETIYSITNLFFHPVYGVYDQADLNFGETSFLDLSK